MGIKRMIGKTGSQRDLSTRPLWAQGNPPFSLHFPTSHPSTLSFSIFYFSSFPTQWWAVLHCAWVYRGISGHWYKTWAVVYSGHGIRLWKSSIKISVISHLMHGVGLFYYENLQKML